VAAALQDRRRAVIVGRPTAGKAAARSGFEVSGSELSLVLPTGILERPSGKSMLRGRPESNVDGLELLTARHDEWGVQPDYRVDAAAMRPVAIEPQRQIARLQAVLGAGGDRLAEAEVIKACEVLTSWLEKNLDQAPTERGTRIRRGADDE
jgi:hypothetical protein